jgi:hypothetical protein
MWLRLLIAFTSLALAAPSPTVVQGNGTDGTDTHVGADDGADVVHAGVTTYRGGYRGRTSNGCTYVLYIDKALLDRIAHEGPISKTLNGMRYQLFQRTCPGKDDALRWIPNPEPRNLAPNARAALDRIHLPEPEIEMAPKPDRGIVTLGEWFWTTTPFDADDNRYSATAAVPETGSWATATATPTTLTFYPGDGNDPVTCDGPGQPWLPEYGDDLPTDCMYTYTHSSSVAPNGEYFEAALEITWTITWESSDGATGTLPDLHTSTPFDHTVRELQAIIISGTNT